MPPSGPHCTFRLRAPPSCQCSISSRCAPAASSTVRATVCMPTAGLRFQDGVAVHSEDDAVVGSCIKVNAFGSRREPHAVPANPVVRVGRFPSSMNARSTTVTCSSMIGSVAASTGYQ